MRALGRFGRFATIFTAAIGVAAPSLLLTTSTPAGAITVSSEAQFRAAWGDTAVMQIDLATDIVLAGGSGCTGLALRPAGATDPLSLNGNGHTITQQCPGHGVLRHDGPGELTVSNVTITGGTATTSSGGLRSDATLTTLNATTVTGNSRSGGGGQGGLRGNALVLNNSQVTGNQVIGDGGTAGVQGNPLTLNNSTVSNNAAGNTANGGIFSDGVLTLNGSTLSGNTCDSFCSAGAAATEVIAINSTITNNNAAGGADAVGGLRSSNITLVYSTVVQNSAPGRSNIAQNDLGTMAEIQSFGSLVALPLGGGTNCLATTVSSGFNFTDDTSCGFPSAETHVGVDPMVGALADNGGPTATRGPLVGSPLLAGIPNANCADGNTLAGMVITTDQRGTARPSPPSGSCDVGSVEGAVAATPSGAVTTACGEITYTTSAGDIGNFTSQTPPISPPAGIELPCGLIGFQITGLVPGEVVSVTVDLPIQASLYYKFENNVWIQLTSYSSTATVGTFTLVDGGPFDADGTTNGAISDPGGPANQIGSSSTTSTTTATANTAMPVAAQPTFTG